MPAPKTTPWGLADTTEEIARGIVRYDTPSHGGYYLSPDRHKRMPKHLRDYKPFAGGRWYEEDADWCIVALAYPGEFCAKMSVEDAQRVLDSARETYETWIKPKMG